MMKTFFKKLDENAGRWLEAWDEHLQEPLVNSMTGEVFTHGTTADECDEPTLSVQPMVRQSGAPASRTTSDEQGERATVLRRAGA